MSTTTETLSSYVPRLLSRRLVEGGAITAPEARSSPAAVLVTDLVGFTGLIESFTVMGRAGLEEMAAALDGYFAELVELVYGHGGDVLFVTGDSCFCYWPAASTRELPDAVLRAAQAGRAIQEALHGREIRGDRRFETRVGVGAGELLIAFVGGVGGKWELVTTGSPVRDAGEAERQASPGEVVLSYNAWSLVAGRCEGRALPGGLVALEAVPEGLAPTPAPPRPPLPHLEPVLQPFVPAAVRDPLLAPQSEWLAEVRPVTVMLAEIPDPPDATPAGLERTHRIVTAFQEVNRRYEGAFKLHLDNKGALTVSAFGLPPMAHENDAERAIQTAQALQAALQRLGVPSGIGIASGRAFCGVFGSELRREYTVHGAVINLAARLMRVTSTDILCDHATMQAVRGRIEFDRLPPVAAKGRREPVQVYRPRGRIEAAPLPDSPMVGRVAERTLLAEQLEALGSRGAGGTVVIEGEAGMGKSTLVWDLGIRATASAMEVLTGTADAVESSTAYYAWRPVFSAIFSLGPKIDAEAARQRVVGWMQALPQLARLLPLLNSLLPLGFPDTALTTEMTGEVRATNTNVLLVRILEEATARVPTVLVMEDAHWLDSRSRALLLEVVRAVPALLTVISTRPESEAAARAGLRLSQLPQVLWVRLEGLTAEETLALVRQRLGVAEVPPALASFVQEWVVGHPFFCEELLRALLESGAIRVEDGRCRVGDLDAVDLPTTVEGVILSRLDRLTPGEQLCLKVAAVIGRSFRYRTVRETYPVEAEEARVGEYLDALTRRGLTLLEAAEPEPSYAFKHVITRDVAYDLMTLAQRQPLHRAVAEWYEQNHAEDLTPYHTLLAFHWEQAGDPVRTVSYLEQAGEQALRSGAFQEALLLFSRAIELRDRGEVATDPVRRAMWEKGLGTAHYFLGDLQKSRLHLERAVALLDQPIPPAGPALTRALLPTLARQLAHRLAPARYRGRREREKGALEAAAECCTRLGQIYYLDGEAAPRLVYLTLRGLNMGEEAGASPALARILINTAALMSLLGLNRWADQYAARALAMAEREGQYAAAAYVRSIDALKEAQRGNWAAARASNEKALQLIRELNDHGLEAEAWVLRASFHLCECDFAAAPAAWRRARELAERHGNLQIKCWSLCDEVNTLLGRGETEAAAQVLEAALAVRTAPTDGSSTAEKHRALAATRLRQGRHAEALAAADVVVEMVARQPPSSYAWVSFCAAAVEVYLAVLESDAEAPGGSRAALVRRAHRGTRLVQRLARNFGNVRPRGWLLRGMLLRVKGNPGKARRAWLQAREVAVRMQMPFEEACALLELARGEEGPEREAHLARAAEIFQQLGADYYLEQVRAEQRSTG